MNETITIQQHDRIVCEIFNLEDIWFTRIRDLLESKEYDKALELVKMKLKSDQTNPRKGIFFCPSPNNVRAFLFPSFLRSFGNDSSQEGGSPKPRRQDFVMLGMTVLRGVEAHNGPNNVRLGPKKVF